MAALALWGTDVADVRAIAAVGSFARDAARLGSDLDLVLLCERPGRSRPSPSASINSIRLLAPSPPPTARRAYSTAGEPYGACFITTPALTERSWTSRAASEDNGPPVPHAANAETVAVAVAVTVATAYRRGPMQQGCPRRAAPGLSRTTRSHRARSRWAPPAVGVGARGIGAVAARAVRS